MAEEFTCPIDEKYRSACKDLPKYSGSRFCVLHEPGEAKKEDFLKERKSKLDRKDYDFSGTVFPEGTSNFEGFKFDRGDASFAGATFVGGAAFSGTTFSGKVSFREVAFSGGADFSGATFGSEANFRQGTFAGEANFPNVKFQGVAYFTRTEFSGAARFNRAAFGGRTDFAKAELCGEANFSGATFDGAIVFTRAKFDAAAYFRETTLNDEVNVSRATFGGITDFGMAKFNGAANFSRVTFSCEVDFAVHVFAHMVDFSLATFKEKVSFSGRGSVENRVFDAGTWVQFDYCQIDKPELFTLNNVLSHPGWFVNVDARNLNFTDVKWYGMPRGPEGNIEDELQALRERGVDSPYTLLSQACQRLAANAEENRDYPLANEFHYWSMEALRKQGWIHVGLVASVYWALSGYGDRPRRAFWVLVGMWLTFAVLYMVVGRAELRVFSVSCFVFSVSSFAEGISHCVNALMYSLGTIARLGPEPVPGRLGPFQFLVIVEGILGPIQIALLALAIRRQVMR